MSESNSVSAGTARPATAPGELTDAHLVSLLIGTCLACDTIDPDAEVEQYRAGLLNRLAALRSVLAERDTECERLRKDAARLDWLESAVPSGEFRKTLNTMPTTIWNGSVRSLIDFAMSAAVAPAARPTEDANNG